MTLLADHRRRLTHGTMPYADDEPDAVDLITYDVADALARLEFLESLR